MRFGGFGARGGVEPETIGGGKCRTGLSTNRLMDRRECRLSVQISSTCASSAGIVRGGSSSAHVQTPTAYGLLRISEIR